MTHFIVDVDWYAARNPDVAAAVTAGLTTAQEHFEAFGRHEGRSFSPLFNIQEYLARNPDVAAVVEAGGTTAYDHFTNHGLNEGRLPTSLFDPELYLARSPDVAAAVMAGVTNAVEHFLMFGQNEARQINAAIHLGRYMGANQDVAQAVQDGSITAIGHILRYGVGEGRNLGNGISLADFANDPTFNGLLASGDAQGALARVGAVAPFMPSFDPPAGWMPAPNTPIPVEFVPVDGQKLVIPPGVKVPEGTTLPDTFTPVTPPVVPPVVPPVTPPVEPPVTPPVEPPVTPPAEPPANIFTVTQENGLINFADPSGGLLYIISLGAEDADHRLLTVRDGANTIKSFNVLVTSAFNLLAGQTLTVPDQLISEWEVKGSGDVVITNSLTAGVYDLTTLANTGTLTLPVVATGHTLILSAAQANGKAIAGTGTVSIADLDATPAANLANIVTNLVTATVANNMTFTGNLGKAVVTVDAGTVLTLGDAATVGTASFVVNGTLQGSAWALKGIATITGTGTVMVSDTGSVAAADLNTINAASSTHVNATAAGTITGNIADVKTLIEDRDAEDHTIATAADVAITLSDMGSVDAKDLIAVDLATTGLVTATAASTITGSIADVKTLIKHRGTADHTIATAADVAITLSDTGSVAALDLHVINITTTGLLTATAVTTITGVIEDVAMVIFDSGDPQYKATEVAGHVAITLLDTAALAAHLNAVKAATTGLVDATAVGTITGSVADVTLAIITNKRPTDDKLDTAANVAITLYDDAGTELTASALSVIGAATTGNVTVANAVDVLGTLAEVQAALVTPGTKVEAASVNTKVDDLAAALHTQTYVAGGTLDHMNVVNVGAITDLSGLTGFESILLVGTSTGEHLVTIADGAGVIVGTMTASTVQLGALGQKFRGGTANDVVISGSGNDTITLGTGSDILVLKYATTSDTIMDYNVSDDSIQLSKAAFTALGSEGTLAEDEFVSVETLAGLGEGGLAGSVHAQALIFVEETKGLYYNADGDTEGGLVLIATFDNAPGLTAGEFTIIA